MKFKFKPRTKTIWSDDNWYDLSTGGYLKPEELLEDEEQIKKVKDAVQLILDFFEQAEEKNIIGS